MSVTKLVTLILPGKNEQENVRPFMEAARSVLIAEDVTFEFLFVDDGSSDGTLECIKSEAVRDPRVKWISLSRNFGKEIAITAGLEHAQGDAAVIIDVDLQHPLATVLEFIALWRQGYQMVYGVRHDRDQEESFRRRAPAEWFYRAFNVIADQPIEANAGDFRLLDRRVVDAIISMPERSRFMKALYSWPGFKSIGIPYRVAPRAFGRSKFNYWKLWNFALDGIISFSSWPLRVWSYVGFSIAMVSLAFAGYIVVKTVIFGNRTPGYASLMTAVLFLGGIQLLSIGVLGEYISRLFVELKRRPLYLVAETNMEERRASDRTASKRMSLA